MENKNKQTLIQRVSSSIPTFSTYSLIWIALLIFITLIEVGYNGITQPLSGSIAKIIMWAVINDLLCWLRYSFFLFVIYSFLYLINKKAARIFFILFIACWVLSQFFLIKYFNSSLVPLGADLFGYSLADIRQTVGSSGAVSISAFLLFFLFAGITFILLKWLPGKIHIPLKIAWVIPGLSFLFIITNASGWIKPPVFKTDFVNNIILNKSDYFFSASYRYFYPEYNETDIYEDNYLLASKGSAASFFTYVDEENYPFLHQNNTKDVLSPFFRIKETPPNIVIILVEGLGRAFTNEGAYLGSFTPFLDSLSGKSLYWRNFLSEGGRTFAVLPSLLGSLPFLKNGFIETGENMPGQISLLSLLKFNGYHTSFYYGGDAGFDNMNIYLRKNRIDELMDIKSFPAGSAMMPSVNGFTWGYGDKELFRHYLSTRTVNKIPQLNIVLTVSTHNPFMINEQDTYLQRFEQRMTEIGLDDGQKKEHRNYGLQYASILYTDDALKDFFESYSHRADYDNTIFLITGDHRMPEIPMSDKIDRYHVPLIIYSPLLSRTAQMSSVSSHFDITPSLLAFLQHDFGIKVPQLVSWMGQGLDTSANFENVHAYPLMQTKTDLIDFVMGEYHLNGEQLYRMSDNLSEEVFLDEGKKNELRSSFDKYLKKNGMLINGGKRLIPDTIIARFRGE